MKLAFRTSLLLLFWTLLAHAQISRFQHVIVIVQENRTPDNLFPSFPAHQFIFGGTSAPNVGDDHMGIFASENMRGVLHSNDHAGCIAEAETRVELVHPNPNPPPRGVENSEVYPCFDHQTIPDILPAGVSWRYYTPSAGSIWTAPNAISHICQPTGPGGTCQGREWLNHVDLRPSDVLADIRSCNLP